MNKLPLGWERASIGALCLREKQLLPVADTQYTYIDISSIDRDLKTVSEPQIILGSSAPSRARKLVYTGDVLVSMTRPNLNAVALINDDHHSAIASTGFEVLRPVEVDSRWIFFAVRCKSFIDAMSARVQGALYPAIKPDDVRSYEVPVPPKAEQERIAKKVDELLEEVDALKVRIDSIPALLKRFRKAVIRDALEGKLIASHAKHPPASTWPEMRADIVCAKVQSGGTPKDGFTESGVPFLKVYNIVNGHVDFNYRPQYISDEVHHGSCRKSIAQPGDVLMNIVGPPLGKIAVVPSTHPEWNINQAIVLFRPSERITSGWIHLSLLEGTNIRNVSQLTKGSAGQVNISLSQCRDFVFPVPSVVVQNEIVHRVEQLFSIADMLEAKVAAAKERVDSLSLSIFAKAFRGELVPQDPSDEPASVLLGRIRAQRAAAPNTKRVRKSASN